MEEVENSKVIAEPEVNDGDCPLDVYTPEIIIKNLSNKEECTTDLLNLIDQIQPNPVKLKKLSKIFTSLSNCDHVAIIELSWNKNRRIRLVSTFLIFSKMVEWCKEGNDAETVTSLYKEVFLVRYRDVDSNIRALCSDFISDWIAISPEVFCKHTYLKYLGMYLNDKADVVRKRTIGGLTKLVQRGLDLEELFSSNKKRLLEMALSDKNSCIREDVKVLICNAYNASFLDRDCVYAILEAGIKDQKLLNRTVWNILKLGKEGKSQKKKPHKFENESLRGHYEELHDLYINTSLEVIKKLVFDHQDIPHFISFIIQIHEDGEECCERNTNCYLEILSVFPLGCVKQALDLFKAFKNKVENFQLVLKILLSAPVEIFKDSAEGTICILEGIFDYVWSIRNKLKDNIGVVNDFFLLLKGLEDDFKSSVSLLIEKAQEDLFLRTFAIRSFDVSQGIIEEDYTETKIFTCLWFVIKKEYSAVPRFYFYHHLNLKEVCELLLFINKRLVVESPCEIRKYTEDPVDLETSLRYLHTKIRKYIRNNIQDLLDNEGLSYFFRFNEEYVLLDLVHLCFLLITPEELVLVLPKIRNKDNLLEEYFNFIAKYFQTPRDCSVNEKETISNISYINEPSGIAELDESTTKESTLNVFSRIGESLLVPASQEEEKANEVDFSKFRFENNRISSFAKALSAKSKSYRDGHVFKLLKSTIALNLEKAYDTVCVYFVAHLNSNECIMLNSRLQGKSKFKDALDKKAKGPNLASVMSENTTYL